MQRTLHDTDFIVASAFDPRGRRIAIAAGKIVRIVDLATGRAVVSIVGHSDEVKSVSFSSSGAELVTTSADDTVRVWDSALGRALAQVTVTDPTTAAFGADSSFVIVSTGGGEFVFAPQLRTYMGGSFFRRPSIVGTGAKTG